MPYTFADLPFFVSLPVLLAASGFFSGTETAMFSLTAHQRFTFANQRGVVGAAVTQLLDDPRTLLITLMLGNMTINVLYFVVSSALLLKLNPATVNPLWIAAMTVAPLLLIILFGEVLPKMVANTAVVSWVRVTALPLYAVHRVIAPMGVALGRFVVQPLGRLIAPSSAPKPRLSGDELQSLLDMSEQRGVIGTNEQQLLREVLRLSRLKVRDVMVPRVDMVGLDIDAEPEALRRLIDERPLSRYVAYEGDIDRVAGMIFTRQFLLAEQGGEPVTLRRLVRQVRFVPELQRVDQLLEDFRKGGTKFAIAVDEYGGTAGLVSLKDVVEEMVGDLDMDAGPGETPETTAERVRKGVWRVNGRLSVHDWAQAFRGEPVFGEASRVSTVGGLVMTLLGRVPNVGDRVELANVEMEVERMDGERVDSVLLHLHDAAPPPIDAERRRRKREGRA